MDGLLALSGQFIEEERYAGKEHHNAVENGVEEQQQYSCLQTLLRFRHQICGLDITDDGIAIHRSAVVSPSAVLLPPLIISEGAELRTGAFIRGSVIIGRGAVVGNSVEVKNSILFDEVEVPHLSYIGDSILGYKAHFGAGTMTSNVRADKRSVRIHMPDGTIDTGLMKMGALVGDCAEIGCNAVLNPGTVIGQHSNVYPLTSVRTAVPPFSICKADGTIIRKRM